MMQHHGHGIMKAEQPGSFENLIDQALADLPAGLPIYRIKHIAPVLGIKPNTVTKHCRSFFPDWKGHYLFYKNNPKHMKQLRELVGNVLCIGRKLPAHLKSAD